MILLILIVLDNRKEHLIPLSVDLKDLIVDKIVNSKKTSYHNDKQ